MNNLAEVVSQPPKFTGVRARKYWVPSAKTVEPNRYAGESLAVVNQVILHLQP
jgi:hypothetical protein